MSKLQLYSVMSVGTLVYVYTYALNSLMLTAGTSGFISSIIGCVIWLIFITLASLFLKNHENKRLSEIVYYCLGDFFGMVVNCIIAVIIIFSMSERLFECIRLMKLYGYNYTPAFVIAAVIMLVCFYCGKAGEKAVAKTAIPVVFAILGGIIIVIISGLGQFELGNLFPILGNGGLGIFESSIWTLSAVDNIIIGLIFADKIKSEKFLKSGVAASITALVAYTVCNLCYNLTFPYSSGQNNTSGIIDIARGAENGGFFQRFEAILLFIVIISMICFIAIYLSAAVKQIDDTFSIKKRKSAVLSGAIAVLVGIIALIPDNTKIEDNILQWYRKYSFILLFLIGVFILIGSAVKKGFIKKAASVSMVLIILFGMTSCTDYREIENEAFAVMIGIDKDNEDYSYSIRVMDKESEISTANGKSLGEAINELSCKNSRAISLKNLRILAVSQEVAEEGILEIIKPIVEDTSTKNSIMLAVCNKSANNFISSKRFDDIREIELTVDNVQKSDLYEPQSISRIYNYIFSTSKDASAVYVENGENENENRIGGMVLFSGEKMVGLIESDAVPLVKAINGNLNAYSVNVNNHEYILTSKKAAKIEVNRNEVNINVYIDCTEGGKKLDKLPDKVKAVISKKLDTAISEIIISGSDIIGLGQKAAKQYYTIEKFENSGWKKNFKNISIKFQLN